MTALSDTQLAELRTDLAALELELTALLEVAEESARPVNLEGGEANFEEMVEW